MKPRWVGANAWYLLNRPPKEWKILFPENTQGSLKTTRKELKQKIKQGLMMTPEVPQDYSPEDTPEIIAERLRTPDELTRIAEMLGRAGVTSNDIQQVRRVNVYQMGYKDDEGEAQAKDLYSVSYVPKGQAPEELFTPATPAKITPSRRRPQNRPFNTLFVFSDAQIGFREYDGERHPIHDERAMQVARLLCQSVQPQTIINLGDNIDLSSLSRFKSDSDHFMHELGSSFQRVHDYYAEYRSDHPNARIIEVSSNHNQRLVDYVLKNFPQMYNVKQAGADEEDYPVLSYPHMANLRHVDVEWIGGYPAGEFVYGEEYGAPPIVFRHGTETSQNGTTASKIMKNKPETHNIQGHDHTMQSATHTLRSGRTLSNIVVGALCKTTGEVPSYHSAVNDRNQPVHRQENWQNGVLIIRDYKNGDYEFEQVAINNGVAYHQGRRFEA